MQGSGGCADPPQLAGVLRATSKCPGIAAEAPRASLHLSCRVSSIPWPCIPTLFPSECGRVGPLHSPMFCSFPRTALPAPLLLPPLGCAEDPALEGPSMQTLWEELGLPLLCTLRPAGLRMGSSVFTSRTCSNSPGLSGC